MAEEQKQGHAVCVEQGPDIRLQINGKDVSALPNLVDQLAREHNLDMVEAIAMLMQVIVNQIATYDAEVGAPVMLIDTSSTLGEMYRNARANLAQGNIIAAPSDGKVH